MSRPVTQGSVARGNHVNHAASRPERKNFRFLPLQFVLSGRGGAITTCRSLQIAEKMGNVDCPKPEGPIRERLVERLQRL
jgi:hypothetical protein